MVHAIQPIGLHLLVHVNSALKRTVQCKNYEKKINLASSQSPYKHKCVPSVRKNSIHEFAYQRSPKYSFYFLPVQSVDITNIDHFFEHQLALLVMVQGENTSKSGGLGYS